VSLYCPVWGASGTGATERHGVYMGLGDADASKPGAVGKPGYCPRCNHDPKMEAQALQEIADLYLKGGKEAPAAAAEKLTRAIATGGLV
jgi:hypothetical protein